MKTDCRYTLCFWKSQALDKTLLILLLRIINFSHLALVSCRKSSDRLRHKKIDTIMGFSDDIRSFLLMSKSRDTQSFGYVLIFRTKSLLEKENSKLKDK